MSTLTFYVSRFTKMETTGTSPPLVHQRVPARINVWLVEDNALYRRTIAQVIDEAEGVRCDRVFDSCEAMLEALNRHFAPEVIFMDIGLPGMSGVEGVKRIKTRSPATQVIILTVHEDNDTIFEAVCAGATGYLLKTEPAERIIEAIEEVRRGGAPMNAQIARRVLSMFAQMIKPAYDYDLSDREKEILELMVESLSKDQIAERLFLSPHTVDTHIKNIYAKLHVHSRHAAVAKALKERLI